MGEASRTVANDPDMRLFYEPFVLPPSSPETYIERVPSRDLNHRLDEWKALQREGWDVTVLVAPDSKTVVALACRGGEPRWMLGRRVA